MSDFQGQVHKFSEKAERAAAQSRETLALLDNKGVFKGGNGDVQVYGSQALMSKKDNVLASWLKSVKVALSLSVQVLALWDMVQVQSKVGTEHWWEEGASTASTCPVRSIEGGLNRGNRRF